MESFDYVVVGAGAAGCVLAYRLSENPQIRVCLIEAGPRDSHPFIAMPKGLPKVMADVRHLWAYASEPDACTNDTEYGLSGAVWSNDIVQATALAHRLDTGTVWINQNLQSTPFTPLAGAKQSGFGQENGLAGLLEFTRPKSIYIPKVVS